MDPVRSTTTGVSAAEDRQDVVSLGWNDMSHRVALVTGASRGLGAAIALRLSEAGMKIALMARSQEALANVRNQALDRGAYDAVAIVGSTTEVSDVGRAVGEAVSMWGGIDVLVNNAGISPRMDALGDVTDKAWSEIIGTNLTGVFNCCRAVSSRMRPGGSIINISSVHGHVGMRRLAPYAASKGGVELLTRSLALEFAEQEVRVNCIAPGYFETEMTAGLRRHSRWRDELLAQIPLGRFGRPDEVAEAVRFLVSPSAEYITGTTLFIDGGWTAQ